MSTAPPISPPRDIPANHRPPTSALGAPTSPLAIPAQTRPARQNSLPDSRSLSPRTQAAGVGGAGGRANVLAAPLQLSPKALEPSKATSPSIPSALPSRSPNVAAAGPSRLPPIPNLSLHAPSYRQSLPDIHVAPRPRPLTTAQSLARPTSPGSSSSSASETETEVDSDSTFVPGRIRSKKSLSQPDLTALRTRLEGWAGGVAKGQAIHASSQDKKPLPTAANKQRKRMTPPVRALTLSSSPEILGVNHISNLRRTSPRSSPRGGVAPLTYATSSSDGSPPATSRMRTLSDPFMRAHLGSLDLDLGPVDWTPSDDADDDWDGTTDSPSSGSLTFSPKRTGLRQRRTILERQRGGLGLSLGPDTNGLKKDEFPDIIERHLQQSSLLPLRLLAIVPSAWSILMLFNSFLTGRLEVDLWPWGIDLRKSSIERLIAGETSIKGTSKAVDRGDMLLCMAWAMVTAHFCFSLTTGLAHRWRSYYPLLSTLTRLLSLQCLCWPATYITLIFLGADRVLLAWVVIGITTGWSHTVQMWVTSNVIPGESTPRARDLGEVPEGLGWWDEFTWGRKWDWDAIAREVGWKVGTLLLVTTAWLFWSIETGRLIEVPLCAP